MVTELIDNIELILEKHNCTKTLNAFKHCKYIHTTSSTVIDGVMRLLINRFFSIILLKDAKNTHIERRCLIPDGTDEEWLDLFENRVINKIKELESL